MQGQMQPPNIHHLKTCLSSQASINQQPNIKAANHHLLGHKNDNNPTNLYLLDASESAILYQKLLNRNDRLKKEIDCLQAQNEAESQNFINSQHQQPMQPTLNGALSVGDLNLNQPKICENSSIQRNTNTTTRNVYNTNECIPGEKNQEKNSPIFEKNSNILQANTANTNTENTISEKNINTSYKNFNTSGSGIYKTSSNIAQQNLEYIQPQQQQEQNIIINKNVERQNSIDGHNKIEKNNFVNKKKFCIQDIQKNIEQQNEKVRKIQPENTENNRNIDIIASGNTKESNISQANPTLTQNTKSLSLPSPTQTQNNLNHPFHSNLNLLRQSKVENNTISNIDTQENHKNSAPVNSKIQDSKYFETKTNILTKNQESKQTQQTQQQDIKIPQIQTCSQSKSNSKNLNTDLSDTFSKSMLTSNMPILETSNKNIISSNTNTHNIHRPIARKVESSGNSINRPDKKERSELRESVLVKESLNF